MKVRFVVVLAAALPYMQPVSSGAEIDGLETPWRRSPWFEEQSSVASQTSGDRYYFNTWLEVGTVPRDATRIIVYALPNGNTIEQTLGCKMAPGMDWHYDIQHVAAQVRLLRSLEPNERIALICAEADGLSWPNWRRTRPGANQSIGHLVDEWRQRFGTNAKVTLTGHSGGGSFVFGAIEAGDDIPSYVDRIAFLDANYAFDAKLHGKKLHRWLRDDASRRLIVIAYDDRYIIFDGKRVVGPDGGTFRATVRMRDAVSHFFPLTTTVGSRFHETTGLDSRVHFFVHPNPENKILHTALVGEMNGLIHALTLGTPSEGKWGTFGGPRAYLKWIDPAPVISTEIDSPPKPDAINLTASVQKQFTSRSATAMSGREFIESIRQASLDEREAAILREVVAGNIPEHLRQFKIVTLHGESPSGDDVTAKIAVMPDYLAIGSDADFVRMPMTPQTAQRIADHFDCVLPTRKMIDAIDRVAELHLEPRPLTEDREAVATFVKHHGIVESQRDAHALGLLVTGIKKDIVLTPRIHDRLNRLALYGWRKLDGRPIQPLTTVHGDRYVDYSHGVRLISNSIEVDRQRRKITDLLVDPDWCSLFSDEGVIDPPRYPTN